MDRKQQANGPLEMFVIYDHPRDYPAHFVVRRWEGALPTEDFAIAETLDGARAEVPRGLHRLPHQLGEDPIIAETWL